MIEGVIFSIDAPFPSELEKCAKLFEGDEEIPAVDGPALVSQLKGMQIRFVQQDWPSFDNLPMEARSFVASFVDFVTHGVANLSPKEISEQLFSRFPNTGDASYVDIEELE